MPAGCRRSKHRGCTRNQPTTYRPYRNESPRDRLPADCACTTRLSYTPIARGVCVSRLLYRTAKSRRTSASLEHDRQQRVVKRSSPNGRERPKAPARFFAGKRPSNVITELVDWCRAPVTSRASHRHGCLHLVGRIGEAMELLEWIPNKCHFLCERANTTPGSAIRTIISYADRARRS